MTEKQFLTARTTAEAVGAALRESNIEAADRLITEVLGRVIDEPGDIPAKELTSRSNSQAHGGSQDFSRLTLWGTETD